MSWSMKSNLPNRAWVKQQLNFLNKHQIAIGFFGSQNSMLLTIVGANEYGATIRAKNAQSLAIPTANVPLGRDGSPMRAEEYERAGGKLFRPKGKNVLCKDDGKDKLTVMYILIKQVTIPPRPFIRNTLQKNQKKYADMMQKGVVDILLGEKSGKEILEAIGGTVASDMKLTAARWKSPPNAPLTISVKGSNDPLRGKTKGGSAGGMIAKITYAIL